MALLCGGDFGTPQTINKLGLVIHPELSRILTRVEHLMRLSHKAGQVGQVEGISGGRHVHTLETDCVPLHVASKHSTHSSSRLYGKNVRSASRNSANASAHWLSTPFIVKR